MNFLDHNLLYVVSLFLLLFTLIVYFFKNRSEMKEAILGIWVVTLLTEGEVLSMRQWDRWSILFNLTTFSVLISTLVRLSFNKVSKIKNEKIPIENGDLNGNEIGGHNTH